MFFSIDMLVFEGVVEFLDTPKTGALLKMGVLNKNDIQSQRMTFRIQGYFLTHLWVVKWITSTPNISSETQNGEILTYFPL